MELFERAKVVRLKSHHDKFLFADEDEVHVTQDRNGALPNARWTVERLPHSPGMVRFRSHYGRYLSASNEPFLLGMTGRKVLQAAPPRQGARADSSVEWEPVKDGFQARLKTRYGHYLRANGGLPPWRNSVTHDVPHRTATQDWVLWDVEIVQVLTPGPEHAVPAHAGHRPTKSNTPQPPPPRKECTPPPPPLKEYAQPPPPPSLKENAPPPPPPRPAPSDLESFPSFPAPLHKVVGRAIYYRIADDKGNVDDDNETQSFTFNGSNLEELTQKLQQETGLDDIIICTRSPLNGKLTPLLLQLPPNNAAMRIVLVRESSKGEICHFLLFSPCPRSA
ncbi:hypothetical protein GUJ93_ZPchr0003g17668 [Zizania palustris]|uniref:DUF569 domain-containing protein n=1 Tax=Zizania palustris TaxID=103762 RepID=A0A8J5SSU4_ZIZPA|nr:hypothetical protein GUJ93_ZPchr0003g17668 [Zizania palustris]